jgi:hypothetical protein
MAAFQGKMGSLNSAKRLTRREAADRLGISTSSVRRLEDNLLLTPVMDAGGGWRFDAAQVDGLQGRVPIRARGPRATPVEEREAARAGRIAAKVFRLFAGYRSLPDIVAATKQPPERIRALYHEWITSLELGEVRRDAR